MVLSAPGETSSSLGASDGLPENQLKPEPPVRSSNVREAIAVVKGSNDEREKARKRVRKKYNRKREKPKTEKANDRLKRKRQAAYEQIRMNASAGNMPPSIFSFDSLFPAPVWDEEVVERDLYEVTKRDRKIATKQAKPLVQSETEKRKMRSPAVGASVMKMWREPMMTEKQSKEEATLENLDPQQVSNAVPCPVSPISDLAAPPAKPASKETASTMTNKTSIRMNVDFALTRKVEESVYGYRRTEAGDYYDSSLVKEGAVQFRDGVRLGRALPVNADRLNFHAKRELKHGRVEEAQELYEKAIEMDPRDGRAYLGLARIAERRRDFRRAREWLNVGIANSASSSPRQKTADMGANPFLLQALGCLEEKMGKLSEAEALYMAAVRSRPSHAAAWVSLAQLRTRKMRHGAAAGRICFQTAERELKRARRKPSSFVYTAWAALEYKKAGDARRARQLFKAALDVDPKCSAAWLQLGGLEADLQNWAEAQKCFETVLKFDQRNSRVLQAFAIMETKRPEGDSRKAIELFERALKVNPRDAGVLQPYALYVAKLGDIDAARDLLRRGTEVNKRHAPVWQAWGVLETRHGTAQKARDIFQQGIWACAQLAGGQSGGYRCARLWQAWGVLEAKEGDHEAARRCFNRALDADNRNVAAITAWTLMEEELGNYADARHIFERALKQFPSSSDEKMSVWRTYELMEQRTGNSKAAQMVYQRSMRECFEVQDEYISDDVVQSLEPEPSIERVLKKSKDFEVVRWDASSMGGEVWMNNGSIEGKVPASSMKTKRARSLKNRKSENR